MALTFFRPRGDVKANWEAANPILKEREMAIEWETTIGVGQPRIKFGKAGGTTHYNDTDYAVLPIKYNTKDGWTTDNPILANGEMGIEWETTIGEGAVCIKLGNGTTAWNDLEYASTGRLKEIIEPETENAPIAVGDTLPMIAGKVNSQQDYLKTKLGYDRLDALAAKLSGLSNQDFVGIMDFINDKKFDKANVYNGVDSTNTELALAASQGKTLHDQITTLNSNITPARFDVTINSSYISNANIYGNTIGSHLRLGYINLLFCTKMDTTVWTRYHIFSCPYKLDMVFGFVVDQNTGLCYTLETSYGSKDVYLRVDKTLLPKESWMRGQFVYMCWD